MLLFSLGIWGMNVPVPFERDVGFYELGPFFGLILFMILMSILILFLARRFNLF